jgi:hypothetical protein
MSLRTGVAIADYQLLGGQVDGVDMDHVNIALNIGWAWVESQLRTNIIQTLEEDEEHLFPMVISDWYRRDDRITLLKTHTVSVTAVAVHSNNNPCTCSIYETSGCAVIIDALSSIIAVRDCLNNVTANCRGCAGLQPLKVLISYTSGLYPTAAIPDNIKLAVTMKARDALSQILEGTVAGLGANDITQWHSMDYSESRRAPSGPDSYIDEWIKNNLLREYYVKRAFSLRRTT